MDVTYHPINMTVRFLLELAALIIAGMWGYREFNGVMQYVMTAGIPLLMAIIWGVFNVPGDPSRSGKAPVVVPGLVRLQIEILFFIAATWFLGDMEYQLQGWVFGLIFIAHYIVSYRRILWLKDQK